MAHSCECCDSRNQIAGLQARLTVAAAQLERRESSLYQLGIELEELKEEYGKACQLLARYGITGRSDVAAADIPDCSRSTGLEQPKPKTY